MATDGRQLEVRGIWVLAVWAATAVVCYFDLGGWLAQAIEGNDRSLLPSWPLWVSLGAVLASLVVTVLWVRGFEAAGDGADSGDTEPSRLGRRRFLAGAGGILGGTAAAGVATVLRLRGWATVTGPALSPAVPTSADRPDPAWEGARIRARRRLGRTNFEVSDISLGSGGIRDEVGERTARLAVARGVNYFDTAPDYSETGSENALGKVIRELGNREEMFLATKFCTPHGNLPAGSQVEEYVAAVEGSLKRLQTDYVDLVHIHSCDTLERLLDPNVHEAFAQLKAAGKARFLGFSSHTPNLEQVANAAIEDGRFDVMMLAYHHGAWPQLREIVQRAHAADMGVVAMKTLKGAKHQGLLESRSEQDSYTQAAFKWVLQDPSVSCLVISFREPKHVDEYLHASGQAMTTADRAVLDRYDGLIAGEHCYAHCGACLDSCPEGVPIHDVLRHRMYFKDYRDEASAIRGYRKLAVRADACASCDAPCAGACPFDVPIPESTRETHRLLTIG